MNDNTFLSAYPQRFTKLDFGDFALTDHEISDKVYRMTSSTGNDLTFGTVASAEYDFVIQTAPSSLNQLVGREFTRYYGVETNKLALDFIPGNTVAFICAKNADAWVSQELQISAETSGTFNPITASVIIENAGSWSPVSSAVLLSEDQLWVCSDGNNIYTYTANQEVHATYTYPNVRSFYSDNTYLYAYYCEAPYAYKFLIDENELIPQGPVIGLTDLQIEQILNVCSSGESVALLDGVEYNFYYSAPYFIQSQMDWDTFGKFIVDVADKPSNSPDISVTAYDRVHKASGAGFLLADFMDTVTFPITTGNLFKDACDFVGIPYSEASFTNDNFVVTKRYDGDNTATPVSQLLGWIAQLAGGFVAANNAGVTEVRSYTAKTADIKTVNSGESSNVFSFVTSAYDVPVIDKVQVRSSETDLGVIVGTGSNAFIITDNPIIFVTTDAELRPFVEALYTKVSGIPVYKYATLEINGDPYIKCGDILAINDGDTKLILVTDLTDTGTLEIKSFGQSIRSTPQTNVNQEIVRVKGAQLELTKTVDLFQIEVYNDYTKNSEVRTKFAADASSVEITSGKIAFKSNTIVIESTNFNLDANGNVSVQGSLASQNADGSWKTEVTQGSLTIRHNGAQRALLFQAGNYDAAYLSLNGVFSGSTAAATYASDGISITKNGATFFQVDPTNERILLSVGGSTIFEANGLTGSTYFTKVTPKSGTNALYTNWVQVKGTDGSDYWAICGRSTPW